MFRLPGSRSVIVVTGLVILGLLVPAGSLADDCYAEAEASLEHTSHDGDYSHLEFKVEVSTQSDCGKILFDLVVEEMLPNGQTKKIRHPNVVTLHDGSVESVVRHKLYSTHQMLSYEAKVVSCEPCEDV